MDILLTHAYFLSTDPVEQRIMKPYPPLGILSIAAYLEREGFAPGVFDPTFETMEGFERALDRLRPQVVGIYVTMVTKFAALAMIRAAKQRGAEVFLGGPEPAYYAEEFLRHGADVVVVGEGEITLQALLRLPRRDSTSLRPVEGIVFIDQDGTPVRTAPRPLIQDIDTLPFPDRSRAPIGRYIQAWNDRHGYSSLSMIAMRGCPYTCTWCSHGVYGETYRRRSPALVVDELTSLADTYNPDAFWFADDVFTINHPWLSTFADALRDRRLRIRYECITRADRMNAEVVRTLKETGCTRVWIGSESGSQKILDAMSRRVSVDQIQAMTGLARRNGIEVGMFIMLGYPGESKADIELTVRHVRRCRPDIVLTTVAYPIKGTAFYEERKGDLILPELPFAEWNDRMIDIAGRYSKRFYWFAHRRIIHEAGWRREATGGPARLGVAMRSFIKAKAAQAGMYFTG